MYQVATLIEKETCCFDVNFDNNLTIEEAERELSRRITTFSNEDYNAPGRTIVCLDKQDSGLICLQEKLDTTEQSYSDQSDDMTKSIFITLEYDTKQNENGLVKSIRMNLQCHCNDKKALGRIQNIKSKVSCSSRLVQYKFYLMH